MQEILALTAELDRIGSPLRFRFRGFDDASPLSLRYVATALDIDQRFKSFALRRVCEIGAGFGGLALALARLMPIGTYEVYDLPEVAGLTVQYLRGHRVHATARDLSLNDSNDLEYDLFISNYALSELRRDVQLKFIGTIIQRSRMGYVLWNSLGESQMGGMALKEFLSYLVEPTVTPEQPMTSPDNQLVTWGASLEVG